MRPSENNFFGRKAVINLLKRRVIDLKEGYRQNVALLGSRFIGKTSLLQKFVVELEEESVVVIFLDLENNDFDYLFARFVGSILYSFSKLQGLPLFEDITILMENTRKFIPATIEAIKSIQRSMQDNQFEESFRKLVSLPEIFTAESGRFCVIVLDEFQNLEELGIENVFQELGKKIMTQKRCIYLVASSFPCLAKKILSEKLSLLFGNFEILEIDPFSVESSREFIDAKLKNLKISDQLRNFLVDFTGSYPLYLNVILQELVNLVAVHKQSEIFIPLMIQAIENVIFNPWGILSRHFEISLSQFISWKNNRSIPALLIALADGRYKLKDLTQDLKLNSKVLNQKLNRLIEAGIIVRNGNNFYFEDKLLRYWVKYIFQRRLRSIDIDLDRQKDEFHKEIHRFILNFQMTSQKDLSSRIMELLHCFDNEAISINGRKYKLPIFHEIIPVHVQDDPNISFDVIKASSQEEMWFIVLKDDNLCENDVNAFLTESKKFDQRPSRKIIISLRELDENTKIRALQERMWVWNEKEINTLLSFYDKPFIVK